MVTGYPAFTVDTPGVIHGFLILVDRGEVCPILIGPDGMACPCDGMYGLIEDKGLQFADKFEAAVLIDNGPITQFGVILERYEIRYAFVVDWGDRRK